MKFMAYALLTSLFAYSNLAVSDIGFRESIYIKYDSGQFCGRLIPNLWDDRRYFIGDMTESDKEIRDVEKGGASAFNAEAETEYLLNPRYAFLLDEDIAAKRAFSVIGQVKDFNFLSEEELNNTSVVVYYSKRGFKKATPSPALKIMFPKINKIYPYGVDLVCVKGAIHLEEGTPILKSYVTKLKDGEIITENIEQ